MTAHIFTIEADARKLAADIDARIGYPLAGLRCAAGACEGACDPVYTTTHAEVTKHPTLELWAYEHDASTAGMVVRAEVAAKNATSVATLPDDWKPADAVAIDALVEEKLP